MKTVLVVDDSRAIRLAVRRMLESLAFSVAEAADGRQALEYVTSRGCPDGVLLDIDMPEMDGLTCLRALKSSATTRGMPVVMCTTHGEVSKITEALGSGADEYIMKPFDEGILRGKLEQVRLL
jgi:two-component system chemotaxis response regulator CheY